jgi:hypothetical protein
LPASPGKIEQLWQETKCLWLYFASEKENWLVANQKSQSYQSYSYILCPSVWELKHFLSPVINTTFAFFNFRELSSSCNDCLPRCVTRTRSSDTTHTVWYAGWTLIFSTSDIRWHFSERSCGCWCPQYTCPIPSYQVRFHWNPYCPSLFMPDTSSENDALSCNLFKLGVWGGQISWVDILQRVPMD